MNSTTSTGNAGGRERMGGSEHNDNDGSNARGNDASLQWIRVCDEADVTRDGQVCSFQDAHNSILIAKHKGIVRATDLICTHADADLSTGFLGPDGMRCPLHLSVFDLTNGTPQNPPAEKPLRVYNVKIDGGHVYVGV